MTQTAEYIDRHLGEPFARELNRTFEELCCPACRKIFEGPCSADIGTPESVATKLMRRAAKTRLSTPARERWQVDPELKRGLEPLYRKYQRDVIGPCPLDTLALQAAEIAMSAADRTLLWWDLTSDAMFVDRLHQAFDLRRKQVTFVQFRDIVLATCLERGVTTVNGALEILKEQAEALTLDYFN